MGNDESTPVQENNTNQNKAKDIKPINMTSRKVKKPEETYYKMKNLSKKESIKSPEDTPEECYRIDNSVPKSSINNLQKCNFGIKILTKTDLENMSK